MSPSTEKPPARVSSAKSEVEVKKRKRVLELSSDEEAADEGKVVGTPTGLD